MGVPLWYKYCSMVNILSGSEHNTSFLYLNPIIHHSLYLYYSSMPPIERLKLSSLDPISNSKSFYAHRYTDERDAMIKNCSNWRSDYRLSQLLPLPGRKNTLAKHEKERQLLLIQADQCATSISTNCDYQSAIEMTDQLKRYLEKDPGEANHFLTMWRTPAGSVSSIWYRPGS